MIAVESRSDGLKWEYKRLKEEQAQQSW